MGHKKHHQTVPKETKAYMCGNCGAVALDADKLCKPTGRVQKADWCGIKALHVPDFCHNKVHTLRFKCKKCSQVSVSPELLCEPEQMEVPKD